MIYFIGYNILWLLVRGLLSLKTYGRKNFPQKGKVIIAPNHTSYLDPPIVGVAVRRKIYSLAKKELFRVSLFGKTLKAINVIPIKRGGASGSSLKKVIDYLNSGEGVVVFPEGTRSKDGKLGKAKRGIGLLVVKAKAPVLPVLVEYNNSCFNFKSVKVKFGKLLYYNDFPENKESYEAISNDIIKQIRKLKES
ncbi:1-acyl-sn-glycerol-3-phosphate acyltransferase [bacterium]|nr:1-acyl-sn-glycerol-3-phosphate acyltransferase [bacterium]